jgi:type II restriction/modification system DNA methylase subunit YeeA
MIYKGQNNEVVKMFLDMGNKILNSIRKFLIFIARKGFHDDDEVTQIYREL